MMEVMLVSRDVHWLKLFSVAAVFNRLNSLKGFKNMAKLLGNFPMVLKPSRNPLREHCWFPDRTMTSTKAEMQSIANGTSLDWLIVVHNI